MNQVFNKQVKLAFIIVFCLFLMAGVYFFLFYNKSEYRNDSKGLSVRYSSSNIVTIKNTLPISDSLGKEFDGSGTEEGVQAYLEFTVKNVRNYTIPYDIILTKQHNHDEIISDNFIKFYLTDAKDQPLPGFEKSSMPTFYDLYYLTDKPASKQLYQDSLAAGEEKTYHLRMWLSDQYTISFDPEYYSVDVGVHIR